MNAARYPVGHKVARRSPVAVSSQTQPVSASPTTNVSSRCACDAFEPCVGSAIVPACHAGAVGDALGARVGDAGGRAADVVTAGRAVTVAGGALGLTVVGTGVRAGVVDGRGATVDVGRAAGVGRALGARSVAHAVVSTTADMLATSHRKWWLVANNCPNVMRK